MGSLKILLMLAVILIPLFYILNYFGLLVTRAGFSLFGAQYSLPTCWEGKFTGMTGLARRNFVIFRKYSALAIEVETDSGGLAFEVKGPDGSILSPASGAYGRDLSAVIDVSQLKRCTIILKMDHFKGRFYIALR